MQQNSRPPPIPPPLLCAPSLPFLFPSPLSPQLSFVLPSLLFLTHSLSSLFPFLSQSPLLSLLLFTSSLSISLLSRSHVSMLALHTITSIHQLSAYSSLATPLPFLYPMTTTPHYPAYTFLCNPHLPPPTPWGSWVYLPTHFSSFPFSAFLSPQSPPPPHTPDVP